MGYLHTVFIVGKFHSIKSIFRLLIQVAVRQKKKKKIISVRYSIIFILIYFKFLNVHYILK